MSKGARPPRIPSELAELLDDPQVQEFLSVYVTIREPAARAHLRRVVSEMAASVPHGSRLKDVARRERLRLSPLTARSRKPAT
jgi:hypothetical protein